MKLLAMLMLLLIVGSARAGSLIPLVRGATWTYEVNVSWTLNNSADVRSDVITWKMYVVDAEDTSHGRVAVVTGFPTQLAWWEPGHQAAYSLIIERPDGLWITLADSETETRSTARRIAAGEDIGFELLKSDPEIGDCVGGDDPDRDDGHYCWRIVRKVQVGDRAGWEITYQTLPDHHTLTFVPGIGITDYHFEHHGTIATATARLVSQSSAEARVPPNNTIEPTR